jgi:dethiobiotin synthetase
MTGLFVTSTGTASGKTYVTRAVARALVLRGLRVAALKPIETGCAPLALDAAALAVAARNPGLAESPSFYRAAPPLAPYAVELTTGLAGPDLSAIVGHAHALESLYDWILVEGAGGLLTPIDRTTSMAELAKRLSYPVLLIAPDRLGVLSYVLTASESALSRGLSIRAVVLTQPDAEPAEPSFQTNAAILRARLSLPVLHFPATADDDQTLASAAISCGLLRLLGFAD